jgi:hypothetical protein
LAEQPHRLPLTPGIDSLMIPYAEQADVAEAHGPFREEEPCQRTTDADSTTLDS